MTINQFLVRNLSLSKSEVVNLIKKKRVFVNEVAANQRQIIHKYDAIVVDDKEVNSSNTYKYVLFYKPRGVECTLNPDIEDGLLKLFPFVEGLFPVGRLDKESEGLLLLTNDGGLYKKIAGAEQFKEKEYVVRVDKVLTEQSVQAMSSGIVIMGKKTRPADVHQTDNDTFRIILTQGINRQIRRMCYKLGYKVQLLQRVRIMGLELGELKPGEFKMIKRAEVFK